jgi:hypothetical protein
MFGSDRRCLQGSFPHSMNQEEMNWKASYGKLKDIDVLFVISPLI